MSQTPSEGKEAREYPELLLRARQHEARESTRTEDEKAIFIQNSIK